MVVVTQSTVVGGDVRATQRLLEGCLVNFKLRLKLANDLVDVVVCVRMIP